MATIIPFQFQSNGQETDAVSHSRSYSLDISAFPGDYLEFTANGVRTDAESLYRIAAELEKIASIIRTDVITDAHHR